MVEATYTLHADADGDELFASGEALIDVVRDGDGITYSRGLDGIRRLDEGRAGDFGAFLDNRAGTYNPGAAGEILRGVPLKLRATYGGTTRDLCHVDVSRVKHWPALTKQAVELQGRGKLSCLARRPVSTTLYQNITTGQAIGYVLDAAGHPKNAQAYITDLAPAGQWGMDGAAGTETDLSGNGNDATVTYAAGQRAATALDDGGDGATTFVPGITNLSTNPVFGHATPGNGYTLTWITVADTTKGDHPLASFGVTTVEQATSTGNFAYHRKSLAGLTAGHVYMAVVIWRAKQGSGGIPNGDARLHVNATSISGALADGDTTWKICAQRATIGGGGTLYVDAYCSWTGGAGKSNEVAYFGIIDLTAAGLTGISDLSFATFDLASHAVYVAAGNMGTGYSWAGTAHDSTSTRVGTKAQVTAAAAFNNIFDGGGGFFFGFNALSDGQSDSGRIFEKGPWRLYLADESGGNVRIIFYHEWSGTDGAWQTAVNVPLNANIVGALLYNSDAVGNDPTLILYNLDTDTLSTLTVGSGLTEAIGPPTGTRTSDAADDLVIGARTTGASTFYGVLDEPALFSTLPTAAQAKAWAARCMDAPRHLDAGQTTLPFYHADAADAFQEVMRIVRSEGPGAYLYEDASGAITFLDRHATATQARSTSAQGTLRGTGTAPLYSDYDYEDGLDDVINAVTVSAVRRALSAAGYLWQSQQPYTILAPGETKKITARLDDPGTGFVTGLLTTNPTYASTLAAAIANGTDLTFTIPTGEAPTITTNAIIDIEGEYMVVSSRATGSPNDTITVTRGRYGTTGVAHLISTPVRTRAFLANSASNFGGTNLSDSITVTISRTGGISTEFSLTNTAAVPAYLFARLYGQEAAVQERYELANTVDASASIAAHEERSYNLDVLPEVAVDVLQDWCNAVVGWYQDGRPTVSVEVIGNLGADEMAQALDREIADRVRVIHAGTGVDLQALVHRIETTVELGGALHRTRLLCESAGTASYLKFGTSTFGGADLFAW